MLQLLDAWGGVDLVILNAGTYLPLRAWELTAENARHTVHTNLLGVMDGVAAALPQLLLQGHGALAIVGSVAATGACPRPWPMGRARRR
jgi:NADP-dependent 3-hydroxy acid dehydrogenase YdfG